LRLVFPQVEVFRDRSAKLAREFYDSQRAEFHPELPRHDRYTEPYQFAWFVTNMEPGIALGRYKVTASWPDPSQRATAEDLQRGVSKDAADLLGGRYVAPDRTPLTAEVTSTTKQLPPFELSTK
jgi:hypothetical protein